MELHKETVDLSAILSRIENNFITNHQKIITFENQLNCPNIYADIEYLKEIFYNLIDNSIKYSNEAVTIRVSSEKVNKGVVIRFWDNGFGIKKPIRRLYLINLSVHLLLIEPLKKEEYLALEWG